MALYRTGRLRWNYPSAAQFPVRGIDVSHHQGAIDWSAVAASGVAFAYLKASEGSDLRDASFSANWRAAGAVGIVRGAYHFFTFCSPGALQARNFIGVLPDGAGSLPPAVDVEFVGNCKQWSSEAAIQRELDVFLAEVESHAGRRAALYFTRATRERILGARLADRPLWPRAVWGRPPSDLGAWTFWQYAENGHAPGIRGWVDLDVFAGSRAEFEALLAPPLAPARSGRWISRATRPAEPGPPP